MKRFESIFKIISFINSYNRSAISIRLFFYLLNYYLILVLILVSSRILFLVTNKFMRKKTLSYSILEFIWTCSPIFILVFITVPSFKILYQREGFIINFLNIKVIGRQWYWTYEIRDFNQKVTESFFKKTSFLNNGEFRLLEVDNFVKLPVYFPIRCLVFSSDVIHRWTVPSLIIKIDANPNQINRVYLKRLINGLHYGQCSEICGINHSFIPIKLEFTSPLLFNLWLIN